MLNALDPQNRCSIFAPPISACLQSYDRHGPVGIARLQGFENDF